jgi:RNA polymerase sigma factor (sigma-70 family)
MTTLQRPARLTRSDLGDRAAELHRRARSGDIAARNEIVEANLALAGWFANKFGSKYKHLDTEEIVSNAFDGLIRAAELSDPAISRFATYAVQWMRSMVGHANAKAGARMGEPVNFHSDGNGGENYLARLTPKSAATLRRHMEREIVALGEMETEGREPTPLETLIEAEGAGTIPWDCLHSREREIVRRYFGFDGPATLRSVGDEFGISRERARQIIERAVVKLRKAADRIQRGKACSSSD